MYIKKSVAIKPLHLEKAGNDLAILQYRNSRSIIGESFKRPRVTLSDESIPGI